MSLGPRLFCNYCNRWVPSFIRRKSTYKNVRYICPLCNSDIDLGNQNL